MQNAISISGRMRPKALTPLLRATPLPCGFMGGQNMGSTHGVFCVLTRWNALTPALRACARGRG
jgi:hypothetical protein